MTSKRQRTSKVIGIAKHLAAPVAKAPGEASGNKSGIMADPFAAARRELQEEGILGKTPEGADCVIIPTPEALSMATDTSLSPWKTLHIACLLDRGSCLQPLDDSQRRVIANVAHRLRPWIDNLKNQQSGKGCSPVAAALD